MKETRAREKPLATVVANTTVSYTDLVANTKLILPGQRLFSRSHPLLYYTPLMPLICSPRKKKDNVPKACFARTFGSQGK